MPAFFDEESHEHAHRNPCRARSMTQPETDPSYIPESSRRTPKKAPFLFLFLIHNPQYLQAIGNLCPPACLLLPPSLSPSPSHPNDSKDAFLHLGRQDAWPPARLFIKTVNVLAKILEFLTLIYSILSVIKDILELVKGPKDGKPQWGAQNSQSSTILQELFLSVFLPACFVTGLPAIQVDVGTALGLA
ncbi:hypothetical protein TSTA_075360 [Talaromyces stipitatus ATCC 10500]|uniref:Uncharacterized protein n=1 Tax=Talaromyces stipitatus (strain ATCC 10500 / CBS 375.48 / QM 6759 / NRRL 1006) TaxID=441959 RepID=B8LVN4_TALSN|nr:uncharacterized protein TSTA_075360 [Talaromyces stipitatus ATCC 10500]EED24164.1 hypothetical protein TSTA_075360 [Talaromyces stipitatus ATCC 10500]